MKDRDSKLPPSPLTTVLKWIGIVTTLGAVVGYGIWIGTIQEKITSLEGDVDDNEKAAKANSEKLIAAEKRERDRLNTLTDKVRGQFNADKDELWELKNAMGLVRQEIRYRHGERAPARVYGTEVEAAPMPGKRPPRPRRPTRAEVAKVVTKADRAIQDVQEEEPSEAPLDRLTF